MNGNAGTNDFSQKLCKIITGEVGEDFVALEKVERFTSPAYVLGSLDTAKKPNTG